ncbi:AB hydrolase-1 domain-containing protein [Mycena indigotica]|uniref:AB hydrolase-1 domain-containing protein n=1 Tax=Mycena indigotica TaxID=2126181 RepID=A0A8H6SSQ9_9AGAR|nr:AB hydrolase-1 domain-containing protein [Mycena indigotica]KAF7304001.1 AB hydrolase-1 domain-containing protein [Mycena indigotica]
MRKLPRGRVQQRKLDDGKAGTRWSLRRRVIKTRTILELRTCALLSTVFSAVRVVSGQNTFDWSQLKPSTNLSWVPCNSGFECARLSVPFDYSSPSAGTAVIAVIRFRAQVSPTDPAYRGPILINPGGPGGSGVQFLLSIASQLSTVLGPNFDFVSFDPRGVLFSTPTVSLLGSTTETALWNAAAWPASLNASSDLTAFSRLWGLAQVQGQLAARRDSTGILKYLTTDNVARDMQSINQKLGYDKLQYYGFSYGTALGATFAAMFPDKIERMILDGVIGMEGWFQTNETIASTSIDAALGTFFTSCAAAGPSRCAFATSSSGTPKDISDRLTALTNDVRKQPVPVVTSAGYGLVDYSLLRETVFSSLYAPYDRFPILAQALADLERGNGTTLYAFSGLTQPLYQCGDSPSNADNANDVQIAVTCSDGAEIKDTFDQLVAFYHSVDKVSQFSEFLVGRQRVTCSGWKVYREGRFKWPGRVANTSFPILFVSNTADPATSKAGGLNTLADFPGSAILTQDSPGHTSLAATSFCTLGYISAYMNNGTLPPPGTTCSVDETLFGEDSTTGTVPQRVATRVLARAEAKEESIKQAVKSIRKALRPVSTRGIFWT